MFYTLQKMSKIFLSPSQDCFDSKGHVICSKHVCVCVCVNTLLNVFFKWDQTLTWKWKIHTEWFWFLNVLVYKFWSIKKIIIMKKEQHMILVKMNSNTISQSLFLFYLMTYICVLFECIHLYELIHCFLSCLFFSITFVTVLILK